MAICFVLHLSCGLLRRAGVLARNRGMRVGGWLFAIGMIGTAIYASVYRSNTGHLPSDLSYWVVSTILISIAVDIDSGLHEAIEESTEDTKTELEKLSEEIQKANERWDTFDSKLDELRMDLETLAEESKTRNS